jgi:hypothetical protein
MASMADSGVALEPFIMDVTPRELKSTIMATYFVLWSTFPLEIVTTQLSKNAEGLDSPEG